MSSEDDRKGPVDVIATINPTRRSFLLGTSALTVTGVAMGFSAVLPGIGVAMAAEPGVFVWGLPEEPDTLDAQRTALAVSVPILNNLGASLLHRDLEGNRVPGLATAWTVSEDGTTFDFTLREDVTFHDGTAFNAAALVSTFDRGLDPATGAPVFGGLLGPIASWEATGDFAFRIVLSEPYGPLLDNFAARGSSWLQPLSAAAIAASGADYGRNPVGTGPWQFVSWVSGQEIVLERNPDFTWGPEFLANTGPVQLERLVMRIVPDDASRVAALEAGELDYAPIPGTAYQRFADNPAFTVLRSMRKGTGLVIHFNFEHAPLDDLKVRQAMHLALNREAIVAIAVDGQGEPGYGPLPPSLPYYWPGVEEIGYGYDPARAGALLDEAGWTMGGDGIRTKDGARLAFNILTLPSSDIQRAAQLVQQQYREVGIDLTLDTRDIADINPLLFGHNFELSFMFWMDHDADILYREFHSNQIDGGVNWGSYRDPDLDALLEAGRTATDQAERAAIYQQVQQMFIEKALWIPIYNVYELYALNNRVEGAIVHPDGYLILNDATTP